jgi:hypothetical protein
MSDYVKRLEERIKRLKHDALATNSWRRLKIEIERHGGKWRAANGTTFELKDGAIYQYLSDFKQGVSSLVVTNLDAQVPYVAVLELDMQGTPPEKRKALLEELEHTAEKMNRESEIVVIVNNDWLSKISQARWGTTDWRRHLKPTEATYASRRAMARPFNEDLIYPGDSFEVVA